MKIDKKSALTIIEEFYKEHNGFGNYSRATLIKRINALPASEDEWVSVSVDMPENKRYVLVYVKERKMSFMAYRYDGWWHGAYADIINNNTATHWQPQPTPPQP